MQTQELSSTRRVGVTALRVTSDVMWTMAILVAITACVHVVHVFYGHWEAEAHAVKRAESAYRHACLHPDLTGEVRRGLHDVCEKKDRERKESPFHNALVTTMAEETGHITGLFFPLGWFTYALLGTIFFGVFTLYRDHQQYHMIAAYCSMFQHMMPALNPPNSSALTKPHRI